MNWTVVKLIRDMFNQNNCERQLLSCKPFSNPYQLPAMHWKDLSTIIHIQHKTYKSNTTSKLYKFLRELWCIWVSLWMNILKK